jgi:protocatechuate 3,4-dioxygenase beta subunit
VTRLHVHPDPNSPAYRATEFRHPKQPLIIIPHTLTELTAPVYGHDAIAPTDHDLTVQHGAAPVGQRIVIAGRVLDEDDRPVPHTLIEIWQANAAGRYAHKVDHGVTIRMPGDPRTFISRSLARRLRAVS